MKTENILNVVLNGLILWEKVMPSSSVVQCTTLSMETEGCYVVNFKPQNKGNCELTSGISEVQEMVDDVTSDLYIMSEYNRVKAYFKMHE